MNEACGLGGINTVAGYGRPAAPLSANRVAGQPYSISRYTATPAQGMAPSSSNAKAFGGELPNELVLVLVQAREAQQQLDGFGDRLLSGDPDPLRMSVRCVLQFLWLADSVAERTVHRDHQP